jgi:hypothetical protein
VVGFAVIGIIYLAGVLLTWRRARGFIAAEKAEKALPRNKVQACLDLKGLRSSIF